MPGVFLVMNVATQDQQSQLLHTEVSEGEECSPVCRGRQVLQKPSQQWLDYNTQYREEYRKLELRSKHCASHQPGHKHLQTKFDRYLNTQSQYLGLSATQQVRVVGPVILLMVRVLSTSVFTHLFCHL